MSLESKKQQSGSMFSIQDQLEEQGQSTFVEKEQFIGLVVNQEEFLLPISAVHEIIMLPQMTFVPNGPKYVDGVLNLRGTILPGVNLRKVMGLPRCKPTMLSRVVIVKELDTLVGVLVDGITFVVALLPEQIFKSSLSGFSNGIELMSGMAKYEGKIRGILNVEKIITAALEGKSISPQQDVA